MKRAIIKIDEEKCNGCGSCIPNCHEGALQIIDDKAVLISDLMCDGLGACIGHCPLGALEIIEREAEPYDEVKVMIEMVSKGKNVVIAHLNHLKDHKEYGFLQQGLDYLQQHAASLSFDAGEVIHLVGETQVQPKAAKQSPVVMMPHGVGCPGSQSRSFTASQTAPGSNEEAHSALSQWPVQMHLINPGASFFSGADLLVSADCVAYSIGNFHSVFLSGKKLAIACPKLDSNKEMYLQKMIRLIDEARVNTITVMIMEVPCCGGLLQLVMNAAKTANRKVPVKAIVIGIQGEVLSEEWM